MDEMVKGSRESINYTYYSDISMTDKSRTPTTFPEHWHLSAEFIMALKDGCCFSADGEEYTLKSGDVLLIWPAQLHQTISSPEDGHFILQMSSELLSSSNDFNLCYRGLTGLHLFGEDNPVARDYLGEKLSRCLQLYLQQAAFCETKIRIMIYELLLYLCENQVPQDSFGMSSSARLHETYIRIQNACNFIRRNCREDISQKDAADVSGFSPYYFSRVFREYTHESYSEYLTRQRIQHALMMLYKEDVSITDVAFLSGFQSISSFSKAFKNAMHCSPLQYRKKLRNPGSAAKDKLQFKEEESE